MDKSLIIQSVTQMSLKQTKLLKGYFLKKQKTKKIKIKIHYIPSKNLG